MSDTLAPHFKMKENIYSAIGYIFQNKLPQLAIRTSPDENKISLTVYREIVPQQDFPVGKPIKNKIGDSERQQSPAAA